MHADAGAHYRVGRLRLTELLADQPDDVWAMPVPACPGWDVRSAVSHLLGNVEDAMAGRLTGPPTDAQVTEQVARHRDGPPVALLDEWADAASTFEDLMSQAGIWPVAIDVLAHEQDIRGAIGEPGARDVDTMRLDRASAGWSHSNVTPTTSSPAPMANRISVVEGSSETIRTGPEARAGAHPIVLWFSPYRIGRSAAKERTGRALRRGVTTLARRARAGRSHAAAGLP